MNTQNRIYVTLSPRVRKALELCAALDGSSSASYAANLLSVSVFQDIERSAVLRDLWTQMEHEAVEKGSWEGQQFSPLEKLQGEAAPKKRGSEIKSWFMAGDHPDDYEQGIDTDVVFNEKKSAYLKSKDSGAEGFGTLMQMFKADAYLAKRLRFSAYVRSEEIENWAGLWMRIDGSEGRTLGFDNMQSRSIKGTTDWQQYEIVLDVPQESSNVAFGVLLSGSGQVWLSDLQFTEVSSDVPTTNITQTDQEQPQNLDFAG